jgi:CheY-like chemotaxis protein
MNSNNGGLKDIDINEVNVFSTKRLTDSILHEMSYLINILVKQWDKPVSLLGYLLDDIESAAKSDRNACNEVIESVGAGNELVSMLRGSINGLESLFEYNKEPRKFDVTKAVEEVLSISQMFLNKTDLAFNSFCDCEGKQCEIINNKSFCSEEGIIASGYPAPLKRALLYMILNSIEAVNATNPPEGGFIRIDLSYRKGNVYLIVEDNGGGIPEDTLEKVFQPYHTTKKDREAAGMGLFLAKITAESRMGGVIFAENTEKGARIVMSFPDSETKKEQKDERQPKILFVEDDELIRDLTMELLSINFEGVEVAANGAEALKKFMTINPDLVITDIQMPHIDGVLLIESIKKMSPQIPVIAVTAYAEDFKGYNYVDAVVSKPINRIELLEKIYDVLDKNK